MTEHSRNDGTSTSSQLYNTNDASEVDDGSLPPPKYRSFKFYRPIVVLVLFIMMNFWTYFDRGAMSSAVSVIRADKSITGDGPVISQAKAGILVSIFMVGFTICSPLFTAAGGMFSPKKIILFGLVVWSGACVASGFAQNYWMMMGARAMVGVGEAAYAGYTVTMVDNMAPTKKRTLWIGAFYSMISTGTAFGIAVGGIVQASITWGWFSGWRLVFIAEVIPMQIVVLGLLGLPAVYNPIKAATPAPTSPRRRALPDVDTAGSETDRLSDRRPSPSARIEYVVQEHDGGPRESGERADNAEDQQQDSDVDEFIPLKRAVVLLGKDLDYVLLCLGNAMYTFVLGAYAVWVIPFLLHGPLQLTRTVASSILGAVTAICGLLGTIFGGVVLDKLGGSKGPAGIAKSCAFSCLVMVLSFPFGLTAGFSENAILFTVTFTISVFCLFSMTAPINAAILSTVEPGLRTYAITFCIFIQHAFGDVPSPILAGFLSDYFGRHCTGDDMKSNETLCNAAPAENHCIWVPKHNDDAGYCQSLYQMRDSLTIITCAVIVAVPAWSWVGYRAWKKHKQQLVSSVVE